MNKVAESVSFVSLPKELPRSIEEASYLMVGLMPPIYPCLLPNLTEISKNCNDKFRHKKILDFFERELRGKITEWKARGGDLFFVRLSEHLISCNPHVVLGNKYSFLSWLRSQRDMFNLVPMGVQLEMNKLSEELESYRNSSYGEHIASVIEDLFSDSSSQSRQQQRSEKDAYIQKCRLLIKANPDLTTIEGVRKAYSVKHGRTNRSVTWEREALKPLFTNRRAGRPAKFRRA